jgi:hypothetical protein
VTAVDRIPNHLPANPFDSPAQPRLLTRHDDQFQRMAQWLDLFMRTAEVAKVLARTNFVPDPMRGQPEDIAAAMMRGLELGVDPLDALANLHVIRGRVGYSAEFMRRRILESGHEIVIDEATDERCKIRGRRAGTQEWQTAIFTADQARKAKINLGDYPADKLVARASSRLCRRVFPDVLAGAVILEDVIEVDGETITDEPTTQRRGVQRKRQPRKVAAAPVDQPQPQPDPIDELLDETPPAPQPAEEQTEEPDDEPITKAQLQKLSLLRRQAGYPDTDEGRTDWFQHVETIVGRRVSSNKQLTKDEASVLIDVLENEPETLDGMAEFDPKTTENP